MMRAGLEGDTPSGGWEVRVGKAVLGVRAPVKRGRPLSGPAGTAFRRLGELRDLAAWRERYGVLLVDPAGWLRVTANALWVATGRADAADLIARLPVCDRDDVTAEMVADALAIEAGSRVLIPARRAGELVELVALESLDAELPRTPRTLVARDETDDALANRRDATRRAADRNRQARKRVTKSVTAHIIEPEPVTENVTDIAGAARLWGVSVGAARVRLHRMEKAGAAERVARGRYRMHGGAS